MTANLLSRLQGLTAPDRTIIDRLDRSGDCWLWQGKLDERGRGRVWHDGRLKLHHRAVWEILVGRIPDGALLCHHCDNPQCANPGHLYVGDGKSNVADMIGRHRHWTQVNPVLAKSLGKINGAKNNWARGASNPKAKLSAEQVREIRSSSVSSTELARQYAVDKTTIQRIRRGALWAS